MIVNGSGGSPKERARSLLHKTEESGIAELKAVGKQTAESSSMCEGCGYRKSMFPLFFQVPIPMSSHVVLSAGSES